MKSDNVYNPGALEADIYAAWEAAGLFSPKIRNYNDRETDTKNSYSIVMPPPNANGNLHIGHGLTIATEDSLTRYHRLRGQSTWYIPGADHAGFETWVVYERELEKSGKNRWQYSRDDLYANVWNFVEKQRGAMELQLRSLGASCSWEDLTFTLDENVVARVYSTFKKMWDDRMIYRGEKLVNFCPHHQTAFADIEVNYKDEEGSLWDIAYPYDGGEIVVSTTRPETLFGDVAVAVNPADERYKNLVGSTVKLPLTDREIPVIADEHADPEYGTGAVKITPAHDFDDFEVGARHGLDKIRVINDAGEMINCYEYSGLKTLDCRKAVIKDLKEAGLLRGEKKIVHSVAHCYKCDTTIEPTLKEQWFVDVKRLAALALKALGHNEITFYPESKKKVLVNYLRGLNDWNISRQIPWGIPIPMFKKVTEDAKSAPEWVFDTRTNLKEIEIGGVRYLRDEDTFDTWFSSSQWPIICTNWEPGVENPYYPLNVMETGSDLLFAWVARMIMMGLYVTGEIPFRDVYLHGLVLDEHGKKMSKSKGNVINPADLVAKYGSDAFRMGILRGRSAGQDQSFSENSVVAGRNLCNKLWNLSLWLESTVADNGDTGESYTTDNFGEDWLCRELNESMHLIAKDLETYRFADAVEVLEDLIWNKYAAWFVECQKLFKNIPLLKTTFEDLLIIAHPFAPFLTEAIWQRLPWTEGFLINQKWPERLVFDPISAEKFEKLMIIVSEVRGTLTRLKKGNNWPLLYGDDSLIDENNLLIQKLTGVSSVLPTHGTPKGLRLAVPNSEIYLDIPEKLIESYKSSLTEKILKVGREIDTLNARLMNPKYVESAPAALVKETRDGLKEKETLLKNLKNELQIIK